VDVFPSYVTAVLKTRSWTLVTDLGGVRLTEMEGGLAGVSGGGGGSEGGGESEGESEGGGGSGSEGGSGKDWGRGESGEVR